MVRYCWSIVRCRLGLMMPKCEQHDEDCLNTNSNWTRTFISRFMDQTPVVNFSIKGDILCKNHFQSSSTLIHLNLGCVQTPPQDQKQQPRPFHVRCCGHSLSCPSSLGDAFRFWIWPTPSLHPPRPTGYKKAKLRWGAHISFIASKKNDWQYGEFESCMLVALLLPAVTSTRPCIRPQSQRTYDASGYSLFLTAKFRPRSA